MSIGEWLDALILDSALHDGVDPRRPVRTMDGPGAGSAATLLDQALLKLAERQCSLDGYLRTGSGDAPLHPATTSGLPRPRTQDPSGHEQQLREINSRIGSLGQQPCGLDTAVDTLRDDLAEIGLMLQEAMPRKAVEGARERGAKALRCARSAQSASPERAL